MNLHVQCWSLTSIESFSHGHVNFHGELVNYNVWCSLFISLWCGLCCHSQIIWKKMKFFRLPEKLNDKEKRKKVIVYRGGNIQKSQKGSGNLVFQKYLPNTSLLSAVYARQWWYSLLRQVEVRQCSAVCWRNYSVLSAEVITCSE